jgi:hypothetical protein
LTRFSSFSWATPGENVKIGKSESNPHAKNAFFHDSWLFGGVSGGCLGPAGGVSGVRQVGFDESNGKFDESDGKFDESDGKLDESDGKLDESDEKLDENDTS